MTQTSVYVTYAFMACSFIILNAHIDHIMDQILV